LDLDNRRPIGYLLPLRPLAQAWTLRFSYQIRHRRLGTTVLPLFELSSSSELSQSLAAFALLRRHSDQGFSQGFFPFSVLCQRNPVSRGFTFLVSFRPQSFSLSRRLFAPLTFRPYFMPVTLLGFLFWPHSIRAAR
jgi:hypothetical protein